jgi:hypothetical protein
MKKISTQLVEMKDKLQAFSVYINNRKDLERIHNNNTFNKRFSSMLSSFSDFEILGIRLEINIKENETLSEIIQNRNTTEDKNIITDQGQKLRREQDWLMRQNLVDFKSLYIFAKIFLDQYTSMIRYIYNWRYIGDKSITNFSNDLKKYNGNDKTILLFKEKILNKLHAVNIFITEYRDKYIVHNQIKHKQTTEWFLTDMKGGVRFIGGERPSITPIELIFVVSGHIVNTLDFILGGNNTTD